MLAVSDSLSFRCGLADCGDGFDWRCPDVARSFWLGVPVFRVDGGVVEPVDVWPWLGRVSFGRCLRGRVEAEGFCRPVVVAGCASSWRLRVEFPLVETTVAAVPGRAFEARVGARSAAAVLDGVRWDGAPPAGGVVARLPFWGGVFSGVGAFRGMPDTVATIDFDEGDVRYGLG